MLLLGLVSLVPTGCEPHRSWLRPKDDDMMARAAEDDSKPGKIIGGDADAADAKSFFKNGGRSGAWSSRAREIESNLGYN
jgi:hypothetical protein